MSERRLRSSYRVLAGLLAVGFLAFAGWLTLAHLASKLRPMLIGPTAMFAAACLYCAVFGRMPRIGGGSPR
jgi:hypothetical protein